MNAKATFLAFIQRVLTPEKARRITALANTRKGQRRILESLSHEFEVGIRRTSKLERDYGELWERPCFVFHSRIGFGIEFPSVRIAYAQLAVEDGWLIILQDCSAGIHRPEARWDDEKLLI